MRHLTRGHEGAWLVLLAGSLAFGAVGPAALAAQDTAARCDSLAAVVRGQRLPAAVTPDPMDAVWAGLRGCPQGLEAAREAVLSPAVLNEPDRERITMLWLWFGLSYQQRLYDVVRAQVVAGVGGEAYRSALLEGLAVMVGSSKRLRLATADGRCLSGFGVYPTGFVSGADSLPTVPAGRVEDAAAVLRQRELTAPSERERLEAGCWRITVGEMIPVRNDRVLLTYMCGTTFRVRNANYQSVLVRWEVYRTDDTAEYHAGGLEDSFFDTGEVGTVRLFIGNQLIQTKANGKRPCR